MEALLGGMVFLFLIGIAVYVILLVAVVKSAKQKGRSSGLWFFLSIFFTPVFCLFILKCIGMTDEKRRELVVEEEKMRLKINAELQGIQIEDSKTIEEEEVLAKEEREEREKKKEKGAGSIITDILIILVVIEFVIIISVFYRCWGFLW